MSLRKLAKKLGVDPGTLAMWEKGKRVRNKAIRKRITDLLER
ncbi:MAG: helix-turn-helix transcriptional regulator [Ignavibacteria bacterium]|nr:helix-turn-helix transcriptional regulator [Ignavibacteria bacterium]